MIDVMFFVFVGFILGGLSYTGYRFFWQWRKGAARLRWLDLVSLLLSLVVDVALSPLLNIPGSVPLVLRGLGVGYVFLSSFAFAVMVNFLVAMPLSYFSDGAIIVAGRGRTGSSGFIQRRTADISHLQKPVTRKFNRLWLAAFVLAAVLPAGFVYASLQYQASISTHGNIVSVGVVFYSDAACSSETSIVDWGTLEPGQKVDVTLYMKSVSNVPVTASMSVGNFVPASGSTYLACTWNYNGASVSPGQIVPIVFTLSVASTVTGITAFSFDISVTTTG